MIFVKTYCLRIVNLIYVVNTCPEAIIPLMPQQQADADTIKTDSDFSLNH